MRKICNKCGIEKDLAFFRKNHNGYRGECRDCENKRNREYSKEHRTEINARLREKYKTDVEYKNKCLIRNTQNRNPNYQKEYYQTHKDYFKNHARKYREEHLEELKEYSKNWNKENEEHLKEIKRENNRRRMEDQLERTKNRVRNMIRTSFERKGMTKSKKTEEIIGCSIETLIQELIESYERNYNKKWEWEYLSNVHIDHIEPLANATTEEEVIKLCNHNNLQLLTELDNLSKWKN